LKKPPWQADIRPIQDVEIIMKYHRFGCFAPSWPRNYAYGLAYAQTESRPNDVEEPASGTWYAHREHRRHGRRGGGFGVRRPLRYLSYQLDLDESQRRQIAIVLDRVKTEREQATLDEKKMTAELADLVVDPEVSSDSLESALAARVLSARQVQTHIAHALKEIISALDPDQREELAYLLRTGAFRI